MGGIPPGSPLSGATGGYQHGTPTGFVLGVARDRKTCGGGKYGTPLGFVAGCGEREEDLQGTSPLLGFVLNWGLGREC